MLNFRPRVGCIPLSVYLSGRTTTNTSHKMNTSNTFKTGRNITATLNHYHIGWAIVVAERMNKRAAQACYKAGGGLADQFYSAHNCTLNGRDRKYIATHAVSMKAAAERGLKMAAAAERYGAQGVLVYVFTDAQFGGKMPTGRGHYIVPAGSAPTQGWKLTEAQSVNLNKVTA